MNSVIANILMIFYRILIPGSFVEGQPMAQCAKAVFGATIRLNIARRHS
jgi:hypothetical protein